MGFTKFDKLNACQILSIAIFGESKNNADRTAFGLYIREEVLNSGKCKINECQRECISNSKQCEKIWHEIILKPRKYSVFYLTGRPETKILWEIAENYSKFLSLSKDLRECHQIAKAIIERKII